jgi:hypothetical protein
MLKIVFLFFLFGSASATSLVNRYQYLSADLLPPGLWTFGYNYGRGGENSHYYGPSGQKMGRDSYFSRSVSYENLLDELGDPLEKELAAAAFDSYGRAQTEEAGYVSNNVVVNQESNTYVLGRGITEKISFFAIFPVVKIQTRFHSNFSNSGSLNALANTLRADGQHLRAQEILEKSQNALMDRLGENGYRQAYPGELTTLANIHLDLRYKVVELNRISLASDSIFVVPAGESSDTRDFIDLRINEEQYSLREILTGKLRFNSSLTFLVSGYYHKRFPFQKSRRIPLNEVSPLTADTDPNTQTHYGDAFGTSGQMNYAFNDALGFYVGSSLERREKDSVSGNRYEQNRYDLLEKNTGQELRLHYLGMSLNTIQAFLAHRFIIPMDLNLQYGFSTGGKNTAANDLVALNVMVFYK